MIAILLILNTVIPIVFSVKKCFSKEGVEINHIILFSIGFWYYWVFPFIIGEVSQTATIPMWYHLYNSIPKEKIKWYLLVIFVIYLVFIIAHLIPLFQQKRKKEYRHSKKIYDIWMMVILLFYFLLVVSKRNYMFKGYTVSKGSDNFTGTMSALLLMVFSIYVLYSLSQQKGSFVKDFKNRYLLCFICCSVFLIGLGTRMSIIACTLALVIMYSSFYKKIKLSKTIIIGFIAFVIIGAVGLIRQGWNISFSGIVNIVSSESLFTAFPLLSFLDNYSFPIIQFPIPLLSGFINLIPSVIWQNKSNYIVKLDDIGYSVYAPLGALNSFMSFIANFGLLGTVLFIFILTVGLRKLYINSGSGISNLIYSCLSAHLTFTFFRDSFEISLIKNMFEFSVLIPFIVVYINMVFSNNGKIVIRSRGGTKV